MPESTATDKVVINKKNKLHFNKLAVPIILIIVLLSLTTLFLNSKTGKPKSTPVETLPAPTTAISPDAQSVLSLIPNPMMLDATNKGTIDVNIETGGNEVTAVQFELKYDPSAITDIEIRPAKFFTSPVELMKLVDKTNGRITYMIGISPAQNPISGSGSVAQITFSKTRNTNLASTEIKFAKTENSESIVTATGIEESVLKETHGAVIELK